MHLVEGLVNRLGIAGELLGFFWWLTPMIGGLLLVGALVIFAQSSAVAPFIYTLF